MLAPSLLLISTIFIIALLFSGVGFGGGSGYLAAMGWFDIPPAIAVSTALVLNVIVAGISFRSYSKAGYFLPKLLLPFALASIPAALVGGMIQLSDSTYLLILHMALLFVAIRLLIDNRGHKTNNFIKQPNVGVAAAVGVGLGLLSGMIGIGGGVFLSPIIILSRWGTPKNAAATASGFILVNSLSGIIGRLSVGTFNFTNFGYMLIPVGLFGSMVGSRLGALRFSESRIKTILALVLLGVALRYIYSLVA